MHVFVASILSECPAVKGLFRAIQYWVAYVYKSTNIPHTYIKWTFQTFESCYLPSRLGVLPAVTLFRRGCLSAMCGCCCLVFSSLPLVVISCLWFVSVMLLCFCLVMSFRCLLFFISLCPFSSSIIYRRYSNFSVTVMQQSQIYFLSRINAPIKRIGHPLTNQLAGRIDSFSLSGTIFSGPFSVKRTTLERARS